MDLDLLDSLARHWKLSVLVFALIAALGTMWAISTSAPVYQAETTIYVPPDQGREANDGIAEIPYATLINQQIMVVLHYATLSEALQIAKKEGVPWRLNGETERHAVDRLRSALNVQRVPESFEVSIQLAGSDPRAAAIVTNAVARSFLDVGNRSDPAQSVDRGAALLNEKASIEKELQTQMGLRAALSASLQMVNPQKNGQLPDDEVLSQLRQAQAAAHRKRIEAEEQLAGGAKAVAYEADQLATADPVARAHEASLLQRQFELRERIKTMLPTHPVRQEAEAELALIDSELKSRAGQGTPKITAQLLARLQAQAEEAGRVEADLSREIAKESSNLPAIARNLAQADYLNSEITRLQNQLNQVEIRIADRNSRRMGGAAMRIFSTAEPPTHPVKSQRMKALGMVFGLALLLSMGLPVALDLADARIYDPATIERLLGFPVVGMTIERNAASEHFADEHLWRLVAGIERGIVEGARTVVLIGLKQPVQASLMRDIYRQLSEHGAKVTLQTGRWKSDAPIRVPQNPTRFVGPGGAIVKVLQDCDVTLMDSPALVFSAEAERLATEADMTLVVVQAGKNTRPELLRSARLLERLNIPAIGVILQDVQVKRAGRSLRRDLKEYLAMQQRRGAYRQLDGNALV
jgi:capsular polysaccharide biosynthesis protein